MLASSLLEKPVTPTALGRRCIPELEGISPFSETPLGSPGTQFPQKRHDGGNGGCRCFEQRDYVLNQAHLLLLFRKQRWKTPSPSISRDGQRSVGETRFAWQRRR
jgi:hypothetical protein